MLDPSPTVSSFLNAAITLPAVIDALVARGWNPFLFLTSPVSKKIALTREVNFPGCTCLGSDLVSIPCLKLMLTFCLDKGTLFPLEHVDIN